MELSGHPLWTVIVAVGAVIAVGLQLRMLRRSGTRVTWIAMMPLVIAAVAGGGFVDRFGDLYHWRAAMDQSTVQCEEVTHPPAGRL